MRARGGRTAPASRAHLGGSACPQVRVEHRAAGERRHGGKQCGKQYRDSLASPKASHTWLRFPSGRPGCCARDHGLSAADHSDSPGRISAERLATRARIHNRRLSIGRSGCDESGQSAVLDEAYPARVVGGSMVAAQDLPVASRVVDAPDPQQISAWAPCSSTRRSRHAANTLTCNAGPRHTGITLTWRIQAVTGGRILHVTETAIDPAHGTGAE